jgi:hypothetical protein
VRFGTPEQEKRRRARSDGADYQPSPVAAVQGTGSTRWDVPRMSTRLLPLVLSAVKYNPYNRDRAYFARIGRSIIADLVVLGKFW